MILEKKSLAGRIFVLRDKKKLSKIIMIQITISYPEIFEFLCMTFSAYLNQYLFLSFFEWPPLVYTRGLKASRLESPPPLDV